jgi:hypothetical protein
MNIIYLKRVVSETVLCFRLQVKPTRLVPIDRAYLESSNRCVLNKSRAMVNVHKQHDCTNKFDKY